MSGGFNFSSGLSLAADATVGGITQLTGDVAAGPGSGAQAATLATVNSNVGSFTYASITVNGKGLITAASSGAAPTAPAMVKLATASPSGTGVVTFNSISGSYSSLKIVGMVRSNKAGTGNDSVLLTFNNDATTGNYQTQFTFSNGTTVGATQITGVAGILAAQAPTAGDLAATAVSFEVIIPAYAGTAFNKQALSHFGYNNNSTLTTVSFSDVTVVGIWTSAVAITRIDITMANNFVAGSVIDLYGLT